MSAAAMTDLPRDRHHYAAAALLIVIAGLTSRHYAAYLPSLLSTNIGDALWALLVLILVLFIAPQMAVWRAGVIALAIAFAVEFSQLYHAPWIEEIRATTLGALVLGHGFVATDLLCYAMGVALGCGLVLLSDYRSQRPRSSKDTFKEADYGI